MARLTLTLTLTLILTRTRTRTLTLARYPVGAGEAVASRARGSRLAFFAGLREDEDDEEEEGSTASAGYPPTASAGYPPAAPLPAEHHPSPPPSPPNGCASIGELSAEGGYPAELANVDAHSYFVAAAAARLRHALQVRVRVP